MFTKFKHNFLVPAVMIEDAKTEDINWINGSNNGCSAHLASKMQL